MSVRKLRRQLGDLELTTKPRVSSVALFFNYPIWWLSFVVRFFAFLTKISGENWEEVETFYQYIYLPVRVREYRSRPLSQARLNHNLISDCINSIMIYIKAIRDWSVMRYRRPSGQRRWTIQRGRSNHERGLCVGLIEILYDFGIN